MGLLIKLGLKNISRNPLRSFLTIGAVALCSCGILVFHVFFSGIAKMMLDGITAQRGHVRLVHPKLAKNERLGKGYYFVSKVKETTTTLKSLKGVTFVAPRIDTGGYIDHTFAPAQEAAWLKAGKCAHEKALSEKRAEKVKGKKGETLYFKQGPGFGGGVLPEIEKQYGELHKNMLHGRMMATKGREIVLGRRLAARLHACVGSKVTLIGKTVEDSMSAVTLKVVGIFASGMAMIDKTFLINLKTAQFFMDLPDGASYIKIFGKSAETSAQLKKAIVATKLPTVMTAQTWKEDNYMGQTIPLLNIMVFFFGGMFIFVGAIGLLNTLMMSVMERRKEIGIMMAMGLTPGNIRNIFLFEGIVFGLVGALIGVLVGLGPSLYLAIKGISFSGGEAMSKIDIPFKMSIKGTITMSSIALGLAVGVLTTLIGSILPARRAAQLEPVDVLRRE